VPLVGENTVVAQNISHYRILRKLGAGGMGEVYLAKDTQLERKVAIKLLPAESVADAQARRRLVREAQAAAKLDHPNICSIYEVGEEGVRSFIVMQYVEGETLAERIARKSMPIEEMLDIAVQVSDGLGEAHSRGIIHRDIKPQNIMLTPRHQAKVMDFGLAEVVRDRSLVESEAVTESLLFEPGVIVGTVPYMSPEQLRAEAIDSRSDIFSFGCVLYEMVSSHQPFAGESVANTISAILTQEPPPLVRYSSAAPAELQRIITKALRKDRQERYQTMRDMFLDLKSLKDDFELQSRLARAAASDWGNKVLDSAGSSVAAGSKPQPRSIAVLPFTNTSADAENEYFCDGLAEELLHALTKVEGLKVAARTSAFSVKGKNIDIREIGQKLNVTALLEGSVRKAGNRLRITAQLINVADGYHLWSERFDRDLADVFAIQDEITLAIVDALKVRLLDQTKTLLLKRHTENAEVYQLYLKGRYYWNRITGELLPSTATNSPPNSPISLHSLVNCRHAFLIGS
jgi:non-specific serine/threonine protein kinase